MRLRKAARPRRIGGSPGRDRMTGGQRREFLETAMDVDLDERRGLAGRIGGALDADALQLDEADDAGLGGLQPPEQIVHGNGVYRSLARIPGWYFVVERQASEARGISKVVDPLVACDRHDPRSEGFRGRVRLPFGMDGE